MAAAVSGRPQRHPHCGWIELLPLVSQHVRSPPGQPKASALGEQISQDGEMLPIRAVGLHTGLTSLGGTDSAHGDTGTVWPRRLQPWASSLTLLSLSHLTCKVEDNRLVLWTLFPFTEEKVSKAGAGQGSHLPVDASCPPKCCWGGCTTGWGSFSGRMCSVSQGSRGSDTPFFCRKHTGSFTIPILAGPWGPGSLTLKAGPSPSRA